MIYDNTWKLALGASLINKGVVDFSVWAPWIERLSVKVISDSSAKNIRLKKNKYGYFRGTGEGIFNGDRYLYLLEDKHQYPDPASRFQPDGVHGPSQVIDPDGFNWEDTDWKGTSLKDFIIYELHTGTFTPEGYFEAIIPHLPYLKGLGITAIELMPVSQFPGSRNWGYDGVYPFAPQNSYGGPSGLKNLINACHKNGVAVILDVVYNHLGPEGNYLGKYGPYFTDRYKTPWGEALNFDGPHSDDVRRYFIDNALYWVTEYHFDALRVDAIHGIFDFSAKHFLQELGEAVHGQADALSRDIYVIPESDLNDVRIINPADIGGFGLDAQWNDDFHHVLRTLLTGEKMGYYKDFGRFEDMGKAMSEGFVYSGQYSEFRKRRHGSSSKDREANKFIVFSQNHDQVGNRVSGDRLTKAQPLEKLKLAAAAVILSPCVPLLFMGEEYGETSPFQYFISHSDAALIEAVRKGRKEEFASFKWEGEVPDPQDESIFMNAKINIELRHQGKHKILFEFYNRLIRMRKEIPALRNLSRGDMEVKTLVEKEVLFVRRWFGNDEVFYLYSFNNEEVNVELTIPEGRWKKILDSSSENPPSPLPSPPGEEGFSDPFVSHGLMDISSGEWGGKGDQADSAMDAGNAGVSLTLSPCSIVLYRMIDHLEKEQA